MSDDPDAPYGWMMIDGVQMPVPGTLAGEAALLTSPVPPAPLLPKLLVIERIIAAGLGEFFIAGMASLDPLDRLRFDAASELASDDPEVRGFLAAIGADPDAILGPPTPEGASAAAPAPDAA